MAHDLYTFPWVTNQLIVLVAFFFALASFHLIFIYVPYFRLNKQSWKKVDYIWLTVGGLAVLASVGSSRLQFAHNTLPYAESGKNFTYGIFIDSVKQGTSGVFCMKFENSEFFPSKSELFKIQKERDVACNWLRSVYKGLPATPPTDAASIEAAWFRKRCFGVTQASGIVLLFKA